MYAWHWEMGSNLRSPVQQKLVSVVTVALMRRREIIFYYCLKSICLSQVAKLNPIASTRESGGNPGRIYHCPDRLPQACINPTSTTQFWHIIDLSKRGSSQHLLSLRTSTELYCSCTTTIVNVIAYSKSIAAFPSTSTN